MLILTLDHTDAKNSDLERLHEIASTRGSVQVADIHDELLEDVLQQAECLVLTGDYALCIPLDTTSSDESMTQLVSFLGQTDIPVLAIGFGFEVFCRAQGIDLGEYGERGTGADKIEPTTNGVKLFQGSDPLRVVENERWLTDEFPKKLQILAQSRTGVEAVRHKTKLQFGLQQRPQDFAYASDAKMVYDNIFSMICPVY
jgi:anthranilate/para-aminobenzoate synthase component II